MKRLKRIISSLLCITLIMCLSTTNLAYATDKNDVTQDAQRTFVDLANLKIGESVTVPIYAPSKVNSRTSTADGFYTVAAINYAKVNNYTLRYIVTVYFPNIGYSYHGSFSVTNGSGLHCGTYVRDTFIGEIPIPWGRGHVQVVSKLNCSAGTFDNVCSLGF